MKKLASFNHYSLSSHKMKEITGGQEEYTYLECRNANGGTTSLYVSSLRDRDIAAAVDDFNSSGLSPIVGCEVE